MSFGHFLRGRIRSCIHAVGKMVNPDQILMKEIYYSVLFNQAIQDSVWLKDKSFTPGRWAVDYCFLYTMFRALESFAPKSILDIGLGQTTKMLSQYAQFKETDGVKLMTIEHNPEWLSFYESSNGAAGLNVKLLDFKTNVPYQLTNEVTIDDANIYECFMELMRESDVFDFVTVDGPPLYNEKYNRFQILDLLKTDRLSKNFVIIMDDLDRKGEQNTVDLLMSELKRKDIKCVSKIYEGSKKHCLITTEANRFLTTL